MPTKTSLLMLISSYYMIGMIVDGKMDIAPCSFAITSARTQVVDFLPVLSEVYQSIFLKNPNDGINWIAYLQPFTPTCWIGVIIFLIVVPPMMAIVLYFGT